MKKRKVVKRVRKNLKDLMKDESGNVSRENILKMGIGAVGMLGAFSAFGAVSCPPHTHTDVNNTVLIKGGVDSYGCDIFTPQTLHQDHCSY